MVVEILVFGREEGCLDPVRDRLDRQEEAALACIFGHQRAVAGMNARRDRRRVARQNLVVRQVLGHPVQIDGDNGRDAERQHGRQSEEISNQSDHISATGSASGFALRDKLRTPCGVLHVMPWMARHADFLHKRGDSTMVRLVRFPRVTGTM